MKRIFRKKIGIDARLIGKTGVGRYLVNLIGEIAKLDKENHYVVFLPSSARKYLSNVKLGKNWQIKDCSIRWHGLGEQIILPFLFWKEKCDLFHFPYFSFPLFYPKKFVLTVHDLTVIKYPTGKASTLPLPLYLLKFLGAKLLFRFGVKRAVGIITPSQAVKNELIKIIQADGTKIKVIPEGGLKNTIAGRTIISSPFFLYVGNTYPHKNAEFLAAAFSRLKQKKEFRKVNLIFACPDDYFSNRLERQTKKAGIKQIIFLHPENDGKLVFLYRKAIALIFPSLSEGFGLPAVEAGQFSCPLLLADIPVFQEIIGDGAIFFDPKDRDELVQKMAMVYQNYLNNSSEYQELKKKAARATKGYSWKKMARETLEFYQNYL